MNEVKTLQIIIPAYNAINTIDKTLSSIAIQRTNYDFEVLIVNDKSDYSYQEFTSKYSQFFNIKELTLEENVGPGLARDKGIENSQSKYIMFIDSDDYLYTPYSIEHLVNKISKERLDIVISNFILERDNKKEIKERDNVWLHGKIYNRKFIEKYNVHFNNSRKNEDNGFNRLLILLKPKINFLNEVTYVYQNNTLSITRKNNRLYKFEGLEGLAYNMNWAYEEALKRGLEKSKIRIHLLSTLTASYYYYLELSNEYDVEKILLWFKKIYNNYKLYNYTEDEINNLLETNKFILEHEISNKITFNEYLKRIEVHND